jgi:tricorn protease
VGHSFVGGGDVPAVDSTRTGLLGADLVPEGERWRIARVYTGESWNPELRAPLEAPGLRVRAGQYILEVNGAELRAPDNPWRLLDGTAERQTVLRLNDRPALEGSWTVTVIPLRSENALRTRAWVEDNRRKVDSLSAGRLAYVWVPNTGGGGYASFNRYFFAQQEKAGAVIDERFNSGGLLDDYMVDYMGRHAIGGVSNDAPGGVHFPLPMAGILGPKVLLVNELAGSGGDYFPWAFRELKVGPLIGTRTWGGLVASSVPYPLVDGGTITAPSAAVFGLTGEWTAEGEGIAPDIEVPLDAKSVAAGRDPQLERGVAEALKLLQQSPVKTLTLPSPSKRARRPVP